MRRQSARAVRRTAGGTLLLLGVVALLGCAQGEAAGEAGPPPEVGIVENLGAILPSDLVFDDEEGNPVELTSLFRRPTVLTLVYLRCPGICNKLLNALADLVDTVEAVRPGRDYDVVTISFDSRERWQLAQTGKKNLLGRLKSEVPADSWHFLTCHEREDAMKRLCETVGFYYKLDDKGQDYIHAGSVMFLTKNAKIVRYMGGLDHYSYEKDQSRLFSPKDMELAVNDARTGTERTVMQDLQQICFSYDPESHKYVLNVNRIILFVTLLGVAVVVLVLFLKRKSAPTHAAPADHTNGGAA